MSTKFTPTDEQKLILESFKHHKVIKVNAVAGSGKSSTLRLLAENNPVSSLYICFNKQNAVIASETFPKHTSCKTVHSLAYAVYGKMLAHKINTPYDTTYVNRGRTSKEIANLYKIKDFKMKKDEFLSATTIATLVKSTINRYQNSADEQVEIKHIPNDVDKYLDKCTNANKVKLLDVIVDASKQFWLDKVNPKSLVKADHDTYQKLYQLSKPKLPYEIIYLDEAQDSSPVVLDIIKQQTDCKVVYVGDTYQSIYAFRQAVNAMEMIQDAPTFLLSKSFRYGEAIANIASKVIKNEIQVKWMESISSVVSFVDKEFPYTVIFRTNGALLEEAINYISLGKKVKCEIDPKKFQSMIWSSYYLFKGDKSKVKDEEISVYSCWDDMLEDADDQPEIKRLVNIVNNHKTHTYSKALDMLIEDSKKPFIKYDVLLTTAHKSKGMEWEQVKIHSDFNCEVITLEKGMEKYNQQEVNLFYVACTRAVNKLELPFEFLHTYDIDLNLKELEEIQ